MNKQIPSYLKLVTDTITEAPAAPAEDLSGIAGVCRAFEQATGWRLEVAAEDASCEKPNLMWSAPVDPGVGASPGHIRLFSTDNDGRQVARVPLEQAGQLAGELGALWGELLAMRRALRHREAELATGVPLVVRGGDDESPTLAERLEAVVRCGAESIGCQAAALYLLDPATTELKLRSCWGLPHKRLAAGARPLRGALADLEALLGHAVVLADEQLHAHWKVPEKGFAACVCVPVSSPSMPLGTLWVFCREPRDFSPAQTNILEVVAGRLAADLERQVLIDEALSVRDQSRQIDDAERSQQEQLPRIAPMIDGWEIAAKAYHAGRLGGTFYDWFALDDGALAVVAGDVGQRGVGGALTASAVRSAARALGPQCKACNVLLEKVNSILWTGSAGNASAGLLQAVVDPKANSLALAAAGPMRLLSVARGGGSPIAVPTTPLGAQEEIHLDEVRKRIAPGELLLAYGTSFMDEADDEALSALDNRMAVALAGSLGLPAKELIKIASQILGDYPAIEERDRVLLVIKRRR